MRKREGFCKKCGKRTTNSKSGYCRKHSKIIGKYPRTKKTKERMSIIQKTSPKRIAYYKSKKGIKRPEHSKYLKEWWGKNPREREKAKQRGQLLAQDKKWLKKLSELSSGKNNANWKGGIAQKKYKYFYQKLKDKIRKRDNYTCQLCGATEKELSYRLSINHIDFNKENPTESNLNALCKRCNSLINFDRKKWTQYFKNKIADMNGNGKKKINIDIAKNVD